jgi:undecaprenyl-diphosphatase
MLWLVVILLGLIEGLTEFIPVSSTGHLLLADYFLGFEQLLGSKDKADLFDIAIQTGARPIAFALIAGGVAIAVIEWMRIRPRSSSVDQISYGQALAVGAAQVLSLIPGVSRSGATIMGGLCAGLDRATATEFSFLLAFPTMLAAVGFDLLKHWRLLDASFAGIFIIGFATAFASALLVMRWLIHYVQKHDFNAFAVYRVLLGGAILAHLWSKK